MTAFPAADLTPHFMIPHFTIQLPIVTTSPKGQVVIGKKERDKLGLKPASKVLVKAAPDHIEIYTLPEDPVDYFCGIFKEGSSSRKPF